MGVELSISACIIIVVALPYLAPLPLDLDELATCFNGVAVASPYARCGAQNTHLSSHVGTEVAHARARKTLFLSICSPSHKTATEALH